MADRLNPAIMAYLAVKLDRASENIRPRISEIRRKNSGLSMNAAAQVYAEKHGTSVLSKLDQADRQSFASYQNITQVSVSNVSRVDRRTMNITNSSISNLSFGDRNHISQEVQLLDMALNELFEQVKNTDRLNADEKSDHKSDIETIAAQVGKSRPNRAIVKAAWESVKALSNVEGLAQFVARVAPLIANFLP